MEIVELGPRQCTAADAVHARAVFGPPGIANSAPRRFTPFRFAAPLFPSIRYASTTVPNRPKQRSKSHALGAHDPVLYEGHSPCRHQPAPMARKNPHRAPREVIRPVSHGGDDPTSGSSPGSTSDDIDTTSSIGEMPSRSSCGWDGPDCVRPAGTSTPSASAISSIFGRSDRSRSPNRIRNSRVVAYMNGRPTTGLRPTIFTSCRSMRGLPTPAVWTRGIRYLRRRHRLCRQSRESLERRDRQSLGGRSWKAGPPFVQLGIGAIDSRRPSTSAGRPADRSHSSGLVAARRLPSARSEQLRASSGQKDRGGEISASMTGFRSSTWGYFSAPGSPIGVGASAGRARL